MHSPKERKQQSPLLSILRSRIPGCNLKFPTHTPDSCRRKSVYRTFACTLCSLLFLSLLPLQTAQSCAPTRYIDAPYVFFHPEGQNNHPTFIHFNYSWDYFYNYDFSEAYTTDNENLRDWKQYLSKDTDEIKSLIYKTPREELEAAAGKLQGCKPSPFTPNRTGPSSTPETQYPDLHLLQYLIYTRKCEPYALSADKRCSWDTIPGKQHIAQRKSAMEALLQEGEGAMKVCPVPFLKLRYLFQIVRLAHYKTDYQRAIDLSDQYLPALDSVNSMIRYWVQSHRAGAYKCLGKKGEAAYQFAQVFANCPSRRVQAYHSFSIRTEQEYQDAIRQCRNNKEKANLLALRAIDPHSQSIEELRNIYRLDPENEILDLLITREINKFEYEMTLSKAYKPHRAWAGSYQLPEKRSITDRKAFHSLIKTMLSTNRRKNPQILQFADAYMEYLTGKSEAALKKVRNLLPQYQDKPRAKAQLGLMAWIIETNLHEKPDRKWEDQHYQEYQELKPGLALLKGGFLRFEEDMTILPMQHFLQKLNAINLKASKKRKRQPDSSAGQNNPLQQADYPIAMEFLTRNKSPYDGYNAFYAIRNLWEYSQSRKTPPHPQATDELLALTGQQEITSFERFLLEGNELGENAWPELSIYRANYELAKENYESAILEYQAVEHYNKSHQYGFKYRYEFDSEPFYDFVFLNYDSRKKDEHRWSGQKEGPRPNLLQIAKDIRRILCKAESETDPDEKARLYTRVGDAWFNTSYHGFTWRALGYFQQHARPSESPTNAEKYYALALKHVQNPELGAKITYKLAQIGNFSFGAPSSSQTSKTRPERSSKEEYFYLLHKKYSDTQFYKQALKECYYLQQYLKSGK